MREKNCNTPDNASGAGPDPHSDRRALLDLTLEYMELGDRLAALSGDDRRRFHEIEQIVEAMHESFDDARRKRIEASFQTFKRVACIYRDDPPDGGSLHQAFHSGRRGGAGPAVHRNYCQMTQRLKNYDAALLLDEAGAVLKRPGETGDLRKGHWALMRWLKDPAMNTPTIKEFAYLAGVGQKYVAKVADNLDRRGFIERVPGEHDKRTLFLRLTKNGCEKLQDDPLLGLARHLHKSFSTEELDVFDDLLGRLSEALIRHGMSANGDTRRARPALGQRLEKSNNTAAGPGAEVIDQKPAQIPAAASVQGAFDVAILAAEVTRDIYEAGRTANRTRNEWLALRFFDNPEKKDATLSEFVAETGVKSALASRATSQLREQGLVAHRPLKVPRDSAHAISLTEKGWREMLNDPMKKLNAVLADSYTKDELERLCLLMKAIIASHE